MGSDLGEVVVSHCKLLTVTLYRRTEKTKGNLRIIIIIAEI